MYEGGGGGGGKCVCVRGWVGEWLGLRKRVGSGTANPCLIMAIQ